MTGVPVAAVPSLTVTVIHSGRLRISQGRDRCGKLITTAIYVV